ncbi:MAG TPA: glucose-6-phosphate dehydrogenase [Pirellulales bacterium]|jgi:glucose-6-phosphate 1-dehydrogenase|nr:glucose-6-phosphate dehydrogenase [Pirellulales bacterium]
MANTIVIFGASGDLTSRKLIPALYALFRKKRLPAETSIVGFSRTPFTDEAWREKLEATTREFAKQDFDPRVWREFAAHLFYQPGDIDQAPSFQALRARLAKIEQGPGVTRVYYLATAPQFYETAVEQLGAAGLAEESAGVRRIVIEKPFGTDLQSAQKLNAAVHQVFQEKQVYRIDHYLGKETVQNIMVLRFANTIFEPVWNRNYIDHVQITVAEEVTVGRRGDYYDRSGIMRDMFQNHLLQLLMVTAMEAPVKYHADAIRGEKVKVLEAVRRLTPKEVAWNSLRGQYDGYLSEPGVEPASTTPTYAAIRLLIDNWRWQGVPFYLRSGKAMSCRTTQIVIQFRKPPHMLFNQKSNAEVEANRLVIQIQPAEGIQLLFQTKTPDAGMDMRLTDLDFKFCREFHGEIPEAYERLLLDTLVGDASLFARADEVELAWGIIDPILQAWDQTQQPAMLTYEPGLWGPSEAIDWMYHHGNQWFDSCPVLT